jgi:hypothetical protein
MRCLLYSPIAWFDPRSGPRRLPTQEPASRDWTAPSLPLTSAVVHPTRRWSLFSAWRMLAPNPTHIAHRALCPLGRRVRTRPHAGIMTALEHAALVVSARRSMD